MSCQLDAIRDERDSAYGAWLAADKAWQSELRRAFGRNAGDCRYMAAGVSTPRLKALHAAFYAAGESYRALQADYCAMKRDIESAG